MTHQQLKNWLEEFKRIWESKKPNEIPNICAEKFLWYEDPLKKPVDTREQLIKEWQVILDHENISMTYEIVSVDNNFGTAKWHASYLRLPSKEKVAIDGIFKVSLDDQGKCTEYHPGWNQKI